MSIGTTAIELRVFKLEENMDKMGKNIFGYNIHNWCPENFGILHILSAIKLLKVESGSKN